MLDTLQFWVGGSGLGNNNPFPNPLQRITKISSANLNLQLNNGGNVSLTVDSTVLSSDLINMVQPLVYCILVYRDGFLVWSGPIWTVDESCSGEQQKINITAVGWFELLNHRLIRTQPGYSLITSPITWSNGTYESAVSGWTSILSTTARDTGVFHAGAGSFGWSESITGPFGDSNLSSTSYLALTSANPLSATPTAGKRYKLNFWARGRKSPASVGASIPYFEILESGFRIAVVTLSDLFGTLSYTNTYTAGGFGDTTTVIAGAGAAVASFTLYSLEWISSGIAPSFRLGWNLNPTQLIDGECTTKGNWTILSGDGINVSGGGTSVIVTSSSGFITIVSQGWNGTFANAKVYKLTFNYTVDANCSGTISITDGEGGSTLGTVSINQGGAGTYTVSFTWTATAIQPVLKIDGIFPGGSLQMNDINISENATDTDALLNIDDVTVQEYVGDGIYSNTDAGAIATALLQKVNSDFNTRISPGSVQTTQPRTITYQQFSNVGKEIKVLSDIESGYDFVVDPITRALNIYNRTNATNFPSLSGSGQAGGNSWIYSANRSTALRFEYGMGSDNLSSIRKTQDSSTVVNRLNVKGKYALGFAQDTTSQNQYGVFEDLISLPDVIDASTSILPFYANAEIAFRKNPKILYEIQTKPGVNTPKLFIDFNIGDRATLLVGGSVLTSTFGSPLSQQIRIFGVQMSVDAEGNERLSGLQLSA